MTVKYLAQKRKSARLTLPVHMAQPSTIPVEGLSFLTVSSQIIVQFPSELRIPSITGMQLWELRNHLYIGTMGEGRWHEMLPRGT